MLPSAALAAHAGQFDHASSPQLQLCTTPPPWCSPLNCFGYFTITNFAPHASKLHEDSPLTLSSRQKTFALFSITFSTFHANSAVLRQFNAPLIILEAVWELHVVTTVLLLQREGSSQHSVSGHQGETFPSKES